MTPKTVAAGFRRSLSFTTPNPNRPSPSSSKPLHVRSVSLPCRSHPSIFQLKDGIRQLRAWAATAQNSPRTSAWLCDGLARLKSAHDSLEDVLQLPQAHDTLRRYSSALVEKLLEAFLVFADAYGIFQTSILALRQEHSAAHVTIRKRDDVKTKITSYFKAVNKIAKEIGQLAPEIRSLGNRIAAPVAATDNELVGIIREVVEETALVSLTLFNGISASYATTSSWAWKLGKKGRSVSGEEGIEEFQRVGVECALLRKKGDDEEMRRDLTRRLRELEGCIENIEIRSERVFRGLISTRVSLLNILTM